MKRPIIDYYDREAARLYPDSFTASRVRLIIAEGRFKRELDRTVFIKWLRKLLLKLVDNLEKTKG